MGDGKYADKVDVDAITRQVSSSLEEARQKYRKFGATRGPHRDGIVEHPNDDHLGELHPRQAGKPAPK